MRINLYTLCIHSFIWLCYGNTYCPTAPSSPEDRRTNNSTLRIVQFNAEWLFVDSYDICHGLTCPWRDQEMAQSHLSAIASVIAELNPDLINLAEVEGCDELNDLINDPALAGYGYAPYMVQGTDTATGQNVGMLTKIDPLESLYRTEARATYPIPSTSCTSSSTGSQSVTKHYITSIFVNDLKIAIIGVHFLAFPDDVNRCTKREAQASVIQSVVTPYVANGYEIIILGDMNDWDKEDVDANENIPISQTLDILKGNTGGVSWKLQNIASKLSPSERYTCWYDPNNDCIYEITETSMIDHILVSNNLYNLISDVSVAHTAYYQECSSDYFYSDHWPVVVDFEFSPPAAGESTTFHPSRYPTSPPTIIRTHQPSLYPTSVPTTIHPSQYPTSPPTTIHPTRTPTSTPTTEPTNQPTQNPTSPPTMIRTNQPTQDSASSLIEDFASHKPAVSSNNPTIILLGLFLMAFFVFYMGRNSSPIQNVMSTITDIVENLQDYFHQTSNEPISLTVDDSTSSAVGLTSLRGGSMREGNLSQTNTPRTENI